MGEIQVCMDGVDRYKINRILEFIKSYMDFSYDMDDVIEGLTGILLGYDIYDVLSDDEYYLLLDELLEMAERSEIREALRWASLQLKCGQVSYPIPTEASSAESLMSDYRIPGYI